MPAPLSADLRARIICAWQAGATYDECAEQFLVSRSTVDRLIHRYRQTGAVDPKPHAGGHPRSLPSQVSHVLVRAVEGGTTAPVFREFIVRDLVPRLKAGDVVIMDGLGAHRAAGVRDLIEACGASIMFQPPYSPGLNAIEHGWSKLKGILREVEARDKPALRQAAHRAATQITPADAIGWFKHCGLLSV